MHSPGRSAPTRSGARCLLSGASAARSSSKDVVSATVSGSARRERSPASAPVSHCQRSYRGTFRERSSSASSRAPQHLSSPLSTSQHLSAPLSTFQHPSAPFSTPQHLSAPLSTFQHPSAPYNGLAGFPAVG